MAENEQPEPTSRTSNRSKNRSKKAKETQPQGASARGPEPSPEATPAEPAASEPVPEARSEPTPVSAAPSGPRLVMCAKLGRELPGLDRPPFPGELGQRIYEHISRQAWEMWQEQSTLLINHYGLNLADPDARQIMRQQMEEFFFGPGARMPEGWVPESAGAKGKGAVASRK